jgi:hypothetical protein
MQHNKTSTLVPVLRVSTGHENGLHPGGRLKKHLYTGSGAETCLYFTHGVNFQLADTFS